MNHSTARTNLRTAIRFLIMFNVCRETRSEDAAHELATRLVPSWHSIPAHLRRRYFFAAQSVLISNNSRFYLLETRTAG